MRHLESDTSQERFKTTNPEWSDFLAAWDRRLQSAEQKCEKWKDKASLAIDLVNGYQWDISEIEAFGAPVTQVDMLSSTVDVMTASIFNKSPKALVFPKQGNYDDAESVQALLNYWYREIQLKSTVKEWVASTIVMGQGFVKMGHTKKIPVIPEGGEEGPDGQHFEEGPVTPNYNDSRQVEEYLWVDLVDGRNMLLDPAGYDPQMRDCRWVAERQVLGLDYILNNPDFPDEFKEGLQANLQLTTDMPNANPSQLPEGTDSVFGHPLQIAQDYPVVIWEVYDKRTQKMITLAQYHDKPLRVEDYDFDMWEQFPYERLVFRRKSFTQYPDSDVISLNTLQKALNRLLSVTIDQAERQKTIFLADESLGDDDINRVADAEHGSVVRVPNIAGVRAESLITLSPETVNALNLSLNMIQQQTGISDYMRGGSVKGVDSATEAAVISQGDQLRLSERREILEIGLRNVARYLYKLMRQNFKKEQLVLIDPRVSRWEKVSPQILRGEYDIQIETGFVSPLDKSIEIGRQRQVLETIMPFIEAGIIKVRPALAELLKAAGHDPDKYLLTDQETSQLSQQEQAIEQLLQENEQLKQAVMQTEEMIQNGDLQIAQGDNRTAVPMSELEDEAAQMAEATEAPPADDEGNPLAEG